MPFAGYENFAACVADQKRKGKSDESAHKICGALQAKVEKDSKMSEAVKKEKWSKAYMDELPDSSFLYVESGGSKVDGKTTPKSKRHFPVKDKNGKVDAAHVRNALSRIPQSKLPQDVKDKAKAKATKLLNGIKKAYDAYVRVEKAKLVIKPKNKAGVISDGIQENGSGSMSLQAASQINSVKTPKKTKKDNNTDYTNDTTVAPNNFPVEPGNAVDETPPAKNYCAYCGAKNPTPQPEDDVGTGTILENTRFAGDDDDRAAEPMFDDGKVQNVQVGKSMAVRLTKADSTEEERFVLGVVLEPEVEDTQKDIYSAEEIRKSAHNYMLKHQHIGLQHNGVIDDRIKILESYLAPCDFMLEEQKITKGTWLLGARVLDDQLWESVKKGELTGWSIGGDAVRTEVSTSIAA